MGQVLPCPKCQKPIAIPAQSPALTGPQDPTEQTAPRQQAVAPASIDSAAMTREDYGDWDEVLANIPQNIHDHPESIDWGNPNEGSTNLTGVDNQVIHPLGMEPVRPSSNDRAWQSESVSKRRQLLFVATIGVLSTILAGLGFLAFLRSVSKPIAQVEGGNNRLKTEQVSNDSKDVTPSNDSVLATSTQQPQDLSPSTLDFNPKSTEVESSTENTEQSHQNLTAPPPGTSLPNTDSNSSQETVNTPPVPDSNPSQNDIDNKLGELFGPGGFGELISNTTTIPESGVGKRLSVEELEIEDFSETKQSLLHPSAKHLPSWPDPVATQKISRLKVTKTTLPRCMELFSRLSGVGIAVDWLALRAAGLDELMPLTCDLQQKTLKELLDTILDENSLSIEVDANFPIVRPKAASTPLESIDLTGVVPSGSEQKFAEQLISLWDLQVKCDAANGKIVWKPIATSVDVAGVRSTIQLVRQLQSTELESPAAAGGAENRVTSRLLFDPKEWKESRAILGKKIKDKETIVIPDPRGVTEILAIASQEVDAELLIDWPRVWMHGLSPTELDVSLLRNRTFLQVAKKYTDKYALELVPVSHNTLLLTTDAFRRQLGMVVPIRCSDDKLDEVKRTIRSMAPRSPDGRSLFTMEPIDGLPELYLARVCPPRLNQIEDIELDTVFGW